MGNYKMEIVVQRGLRGEIPEQIEFYNLDAIIAVGYRVNSRRATQFRIWATQILKEYVPGQGDFKVKGTGKGMI